MTEPTPEDVERVARAMWNAYRNHPESGEDHPTLRATSWEDLASLAEHHPRAMEITELGRIEARAAIAAMWPHSSTAEQAAHNGHVAGSTPAAATDHSSLIRELRDALYAAETVMTIVEPRSHKAEYLETLAKVRAALRKASKALGEKA